MILLFFGSFNPVHIGHLLMASWCLNHVNDLESIWFVISPQSPFKDIDTLIPLNIRIKALQAAIENVPKMQVCDIETKLSVPSYTYVTLQELRKIYPEKNFAILMGDDTYSSLPLWKNSNWIIENFDIYVYPRYRDSINMPMLSPRAIILTAPKIEVSSTGIRAALSEGKIPYFFVPEKALEIILKTKAF